MFSSLSVIFRFKIISISKSSIARFCESSSSSANDTIPPVRVFVKNRYRYFIDSLRLTVRAGSGGNGFPRYGGIGGKGGDVYVEGVEGKTLKEMRDKRNDIKAGLGEHACVSKILGKNGNDYVVHVPVGITVMSQMGRVLGQINKHGDKVLVAQGGQGGNKMNNYCGTKGQQHAIILDLKLLADVGLVGFPNAGKSTLLKSLSRAMPKIASYPFTTITPNVGTMEYDDFRQISVTDLPGLIEGAHANIGLGHKFLKHIERTKMLLFVIDINGFRYRPDFPHRSAIETLLLLNKELELYDERLLSKPSMLVVSKIDDSIHEEKYETFLNQLKTLMRNEISMESVIQDENSRPKQLIKFDEIIPVCAKKAFNIEKLKYCIRELIDVNHELEKEKKGELITFRAIQDKDKKKTHRYLI